MPIATVTAPITSEFLAEAGATQTSDEYWAPREAGHELVLAAADEPVEFSAFTYAELRPQLPDSVEYNGTQNFTLVSEPHGRYRIRYGDIDLGDRTVGLNDADALGRAYLWLKEEGLI